MIPGFRCVACGHVDLPEFTRYWDSPKHPLCSLCDPRIAKWHGVFERRWVAPSEADQWHMVKAWSDSHG